jgi:hypothetical protein
MTERQKLNNEIRLLRSIVTLLTAYGKLTHGLDVDMHLDLYQTWLQEAIAERETLPVKGSAKKPSYNQHPEYEQWKSICPKCRSAHSRHHSGSREYDVTLRCADCKDTFTLKEAFDAELARQKHEAK